MHEYYQIKDAVSSLLKVAKFIEESENSQVDDFGSIQTIFVSDTKCVLLGWNGEEGFGYVKVWKDRGWEMLPTEVLEGSAVNFQNAIERLCEDLQGYI